MTSPIDEILGDSAPAYREAMDAVHRFARASKCPLGYDVVLWLSQKSVDLDRDIRKLRRMRKETE